MQRRIRTIACIWILFGAISILRLSAVMLLPDISIFSHKSTWPYQAVLSADMEHLTLRQTDDGRGRILFRNGQPWVEPGIYPTVSGVIGKPDKWPDERRVVPEQGRSGLEYTFDRILASRRPGFVGYLKDASGRTSDRIYQVRPERGSDVRTTIDYAWQRTADGLLKRYGIGLGAIVVLDTKSNEVMALASRNTARPTDIVAVKAFTPGSIFKLVTAAAAYETYEVQPDDEFYCKGFIHTPRVHMHCWRAHGTLRFEDAIAESCDVVFARVGIRVGPGAIQEVAKRFGLFGSGLQTLRGTPVLSEAESGVTYRVKRADEGLLANTAIGQQDVLLTPLQGANIAATIANGGLYREAHLIRDVEQDGHEVQHFSSQRGRRALTWMTAAKVSRGMQLAVTSPEGTAHALNRQTVAVAAKTGTAELRSGHVNGWMVGFAPYDNPRIAFCVFTGHVSSKEAHRVGPEIVQGLLRAYKQFHSPSDIR